MTGSERREILKAGGVALTVGLAGCIGPFQDGEGVPGTTDPDPNTGNGNGNGNGGVPSAVDEYLSDANQYDGSLQDMTGQESVTVEVGAGNGLAFAPAAIQVDPGTTVTWEWTGEGGGHNVIHEEGAFDSGDLVSEEGHTFEHTFEEEGSFRYFCRPHKGVGMKGAVVVGGSGGGGGGGGGGVPSAVDEYLSDANQYDGSLQDMTGQDSVTVEVGAGNGLAFAPAAIQVDPGATVTWEWTGEGGAHNVVAEDETFNSGETEEGSDITFEYTFEEEGNFLYYCTPHKGLGMKGAVVVGGGGGGNGGGGGGVPGEVDEFLSDANLYEGSAADMTGQDEVSVAVGAGDNGIAFDPPAIRVDAGTTVVWEWTGEGGAHNVVAEDDTFNSGETVDSGDETFEYTFEETGNYTYVCTPHAGIGMKGAVIVE
jgi:halocyanin-like protein